MPQARHCKRSVDRRDFVKAALIPAALSIPATLPSRAAHAGDPAQVPEEAGPEIIDSNVHLFEWPFRQLKYATTDALLAKLRRHRIRQAWAGSFEAVLRTQLDTVNRRLTHECEAHGDGMLIPIGSINPGGPDWEEDLRRCQDQYRMPGLRLYPAYHGYTLDHPDFKRTLQLAAQRGMLVQIALRLEDERVHHPALDVPRVDVSSLSSTLQAIPTAKVQLINSAGPLLGNSLPGLVRETRITFDIAAIESNGGVGRLIQGRNRSYRGAIPVDRLLFGSHAPFFPCESAVMKLFESPLTLEQLRPLMYANAERLIGAASRS